MRKDAETSDNSNGQESRLWLAVAVSFTMIFTSYAVSVFNNRDGDGMNAQTYTDRPSVVSYLA